MTGLGDPLRLACGLVLPNRLMKAALSEGLADGEHRPDDRLERLFARWGSGGYGLVVTGNVMVDRDHLGEPGNVVLDRERDLDRLSRWAKTTKDGGAPIWAQLNHPGRQSNPLATRSRPVAPSAIALNLPGLPTPRALSEAEIEEIIERFAAAAALAESAGFDGVQVHGAHGYLVSQFLSPLSNQREDAWGGDPERRMRFALEVVRRIRATVRPGFAVGIKLNSADFQRGGFGQDESRAVIEHLAAEQVDLIEISGGSYESPAMMGRPVVQSTSTREREAYFLSYAQSAREAAGTVPLAVTGGFRSRAAMDEAVGSGACEVIGLGRPTVISPEAANELLAGRDRLDAPRISSGLPRGLANRRAVKSLDGLLDLQWHTDQLHRLGAGEEPVPDRPAWRTGVSMLKRNGFDAFRGSGRNAGPGSERSLRRFRFERAVGRYLANPAVRGLSRLGIRVSLATEIETIGRKTGQPRRVPVSVLFDTEGAWLICQHGTRSGWGANLTANPGIRLRQGDRWRTGTAVFVPEDDVEARARSFAPHPALGALSAATFRALQTRPVSVRVTFTDD
ncbi:nitroreductase family deazaflavin-dependent oxidoreductase [Sciscionella sediminilitoris]|uniref:nitroreductase family deazaflavin-dependent oxidoreductase n=1 Tax=Sciscionella sediminilitoris TaxID=1445613 RepID=UPI0004DFC788|nr:nitroreductase family deazaflavin-dependent oxidoreductase [Sciscionella sp. SE31]